jgi:hypothetical protein
MNFNNSTDRFMSSLHYVYISWWWCQTLLNSIILDYVHFPTLQTWNINFADDQDNIQYEQAKITLCNKQRNSWLTDWFMGF